MKYISLEDRIARLECLLLNRQPLKNEGILDGIKNLKDRMTNKKVMDTEELISNVKLELDTIASQLGNKIDDMVGFTKWSKPNIRLTSGDTVECTVIGENRLLPHTKSNKDTITIHLVVDVTGAKNIKDCVVNGDIYINSKVTTADEPKPLHIKDKILRLSEPDTCKKIAKTFKLMFDLYVDKF